jgi:hypothetical protein
VPTFHRRIYWLLDPSLSALVLVHYLDKTRCASARPSLPAVPVVPQSAWYTAIGNAVATRLHRVATAPTRLATQCRMCRSVLEHGAGTLGCRAPLALACVPLIDAIECDGAGVGTVLRIVRTVLRIIRTLFRRSDVLPR